MDYYHKYQKYKYKYNRLRKNLIQSGGSSGTAKFCLFKAEWCGHCQKFKPVWDGLQQFYGGSKDIKFETYDADADPEKVKEYAVRGFPSLFFEREGNRVEYNRSRAVGDIISFLEQQGVQPPQN